MTSRAANGAVPEIMQIPDIVLKLNLLRRGYHSITNT